MPAFPIFVRSLGGRCKKYDVTDETTIESLQQQQWNEETVPEFHEVYLYHDNIEIREGTVRDACLTQGSELSAVVSGPTQNKHMQTIMQLRTEKLWDECNKPTPAAYRCARAAYFLGEYFDEWESATVDALHAILLDEHPCSARATDPQCSSPIIVAAGKVFGRICAPASQYIPSLIACLPNDASIIALGEIDARGLFPLKQKRTLMQQWCHGNGGYDQFPSHETYESILAQTRLVAQIPDSEMWQLYKYHLEAQFFEEDENGWAMEENMGILGLF